MFVRWNLTVWGATQSSFAIAAFDFPWASAVRIASSRAVRPADLAARVGGVVGEADRGVDGLVDRLADHRGQVDRVDALDDVGARAALEDVLDQLLVRRGREDDHLDLGVALLDLVEADEPVHAGHADVEHDDVGLGALDEREHLAAGHRLADDLELAGLLERAAGRSSRISWWSSARRTRERSFFVVAIDSKVCPNHRTSARIEPDAASHDGCGPRARSDDLDDAGRLPAHEPPLPDRRLDLLAERLLAERPEQGDLELSGRAGLDDRSHPRLEKLAEVAGRLGVSHPQTHRAGLSQVVLDRPSSIGEDRQRTFDGKHGRRSGPGDADSGRELQPLRCRFENRVPGPSASTFPDAGRTRRCSRSD